MKPASTIRVSLLYFARSQWRNLEKESRPITAPMPNVPRIRRLCPVASPDTRPEMADIIYWYLPRIRRMKLPEMPGSIIAHIAMAPLMKTNHSPSGVLVGERVHITVPSTIPKARRHISLTLQSEMPRRMNIDEAAMSPKKKAHVRIGWLLSRYCISPASEITLMPIPMNRLSRKLPLMCFQNALNFPLRSSFTASVLMDASEPTNSS